MVQVERLIAKTVVINNGNDEEREYTISASFQVNEQVCNSVNGDVKNADGAQLCSFSAWGNNKNYNFSEVDDDEQFDVMRAIKTFINEGKAVAIQ